jgi:uncharacterized protein YjbI with pentapeptide repeats
MTITNGINLDIFHFKETYLTKTNNHRYDLKKDNLIGANFEEANLEEIDLAGTNLREANLQGANLERINLNKLTLKERISKTLTS